MGLATSCQSAAADVSRGGPAMTCSCIFRRQPRSSIEGVIRIRGLPAGPSAIELDEAFLFRSLCRGEDEALPLPHRSMEYVSRDRSVDDRDKRPSVTGDSSPWIPQMSAASSFLARRMANLTVLRCSITWRLPGALRLALGDADDTSLGASADPTESRLRRQ